MEDKIKKIIKAKETRNHNQMVLSQMKEELIKDLYQDCLDLFSKDYSVSLRGKTDILISFDWHTEVRISFYGQTISVDLPNAYKTFITFLQMEIYRAILKYQDRLLNIEFAYHQSENENDEWDLKQELKEEIKEVIFSELETKGSYGKFFMKKGQRGRFEFGVEGSWEVKKLYKKDILPLLNKEAENYMVGLINTYQMVVEA